jgi:hypothetical protein
LGIIQEEAMKFRSRSSRGLAALTVSVLTGSAFFVGLSQPASARSTVTAAVCQAPNNSDTALYYLGASVTASQFVSGSNSYTYVMCPVLVDHDIGTARFRARVVDNSTASGFFGKITCFGTVYDSNGNAVSSASDETGDVTTGEEDLDYTVSAGPSWTSFLSYDSLCYIPFRQTGGQASSIKRFIVD